MNLTAYPRRTTVLLVLLALLCCAGLVLIGQHIKANQPCLERTTKDGCEHPYHRLVAFDGVNLCLCPRGASGYPTSPTTPGAYEGR